MKVIKNDELNFKLKTEGDMLYRKNTEILDQAHQMRAGGTSDEPINHDEVMELLAKENYFAKDIESWFDSMQGFYRWECNIISLKPSAGSF